LKDNENVIETLASRIVGRYSLYDVTDPVTDEILVEAGEIYFS
jgi:DNA-directed RNA polymerase subunit beta'